MIKIVSSILFPACAIMMLIALVSIKVSGSYLTEPNTVILNAEISLFSVFSVIALSNLIYMWRTR